ncbi:MAG: hypothetical protein ACI8XM_002822 [Haloarculaceae archaeon]|jgi:hypothetical protein
MLPGASTGPSQSRPASVTETPAPRAPLSVETDLELSIDGIRPDVGSTGDRLFVDFPSLSAAETAMRGLPQGSVGELTELLAATDLTVEVRSRGRTVTAIGADATPGPLSQRLGFAPAQVRVAGIVAAVGQEFAAGVRRVRQLLE